ncbi:50S ribosomal protein L20 [Candidatus Collierbacteria bacterium CG1_02_44_10]|uniref:Large ribosomal subunit protein bL20 n=3 Tax=Candidatus Collieribacteriota TaxID=1752725 RepID=A0A2H0DUA6_9BACT|nr:MAG: 50S ribosomal protein L20 [Candidatus Collierbacteria bacterium CG1_02_44_10]PIP85309.1 MAG: 50S ribosomal protein L20 [Candidatus Collierbacteria bacterium CG22_combo_CG10-13_8_21_14_all_43_12]PIS00164.1 MAG: 50S ribosomal protein L20 [Candidatus Collierbacteria bacterium CG10_big_fil_rev_8_21_14_0_10_43_36]
MPRTKTGTVRRRGHKKVLQLAKGFRMTRNRLYKTASEAVLHAGQYAYNGRKERKQQMRITWITRINSALSSIAEAPKYSRFIKALSNKKIALNRKVLAALATNLPNAFRDIVFFTVKK